MYGKDRCSTLPWFSCSKPAADSSTSASFFFCSVSGRGLGRRRTSGLLTIRRRPMFRATSGDLAAGDSSLVVKGWFAILRLEFLVKFGPGQAAGAGAGSEIWGWALAIRKKFTKDWAADHCWALLGTSPKWCIGVPELAYVWGNDGGVWEASW